MIIDTHTHLYDEAFNADFESVISRAKQVGVAKCIMPAIDISSYESMIKVESLLSGFAYSTIGLHPTSVNDTWERELSFVKETLSSRDFCAIGEIGLDGYWSRDFIEQQKEAFFQQLVWAHQKGLPVIIHLREATIDLFEVLDRVKSEGITPRGVFHAFSGSIETYERINKYGDFYVGIGGVVTYKKASIADVVKELPLERILLETDSPWLTPVPYRGKRNEPSYLKEIISKISELKGCDGSLVEDTTSINAMNLFGLK